MAVIWTEKYFPQNFGEFVGNIEVAEAVQKWASAWVSGKNQKPLLLFGAPGVGKTCISLLAAKNFEWDVFELNASDFRTKDIIDRIAGAALQGGSFSGQKRLVLLDEVDGLQARDKGGAAAIARILKESSNPVILTANDVYSNQKIAPVREQCQLLQFKKINYLSISKRLREILETEGVSFDAEAVKQLAKNSGGDFRSALIDAQSLSFEGAISRKMVDSVGYRERKENVFKALEAIFKGTSFDEVRKARFQAEVSDDLLFRWVEENIPRVYGTEDAARAFEKLSRADVFEGRIFNRQHYGFKRYSSELYSTGVALSKEQEYHGWLKFQFPVLLKSLSKSSSLRALKKELGSKIGAKTHSSRRAVASDLPFMKILFENKGKAVQLSAAFDLTEREIALLLNTKPDTKKVKNVFEKAQSLRKEDLISRRKPLAAVSEKELQFSAPEFDSEQEENQKEKEGSQQTTLF